MSVNTTKSETQVAGTMANVNKAGRVVEAFFVSFFKKFFFFFLNLSFCSFNIFWYRSRVFFFFFWAEKYNLEEGGGGRNLWEGDQQVKPHRPGGSCEGKTEGGQVGARFRCSNIGPAPGSGTPAPHSRPGPFWYPEDAPLQRTGMPGAPCWAWAPGPSFSSMFSALCGAGQARGGCRWGCPVPAPRRGALLHAAPR